MVGPAAVRVYHLRPARAGCRLQLGRWGQARLESLHDLSEGGGRAPKALGGGRLLPSLATARPLLGSEGGRYLGRGSRDGEGPGCGCSGGKQQRQEQEHYRRGSHFGSLQRGSLQCLGLEPVASGDVRRRWARYKSARKGVTHKICLNFWPECRCKHVQASMDTIYLHTSYRPVSN